MFFFYKQKTAYEFLSGLVGTEMCIRDRCVLIVKQLAPMARKVVRSRKPERRIVALCVLIVEQLAPMERKVVRSR